MEKNVLTCTKTNCACRENEPKTCDSLYVSIDGVRPKPRFVAWIDIMGGKSVMWRSMSTCAIFVGKLYDAIDKAQNAVASQESHVFKMGDGVYVCGDEFGVVCGIAERAIRSCAHDFLEKGRNPFHRFLLRAAIAYGDTIIAKDVQNTERIVQNSAQNNNNTNNQVDLSAMLIGAPVAWAHEAEHKAPPFGIFLHESCRSHSCSSGKAIGWVLNKWWLHEDMTFIKNFSKELQSHLDWEVKNKIETGIDPEKARAYRESVEEYFQCSDDTKGCDSF